MINTKQPGKHYSLKLIFITLLLTINCQKPTAIEFLNQTRNALNDLSSTSVNIFNLSNEWLNKILNPQNIITSYSLFNLPLVKSENIADEDISKDEDVELLIQSQCLEQNRIFLSEQDQRVNFDMILSRPPSSNINITFVNDKPDLFEIQPEYIFYKNAYYSTTSNNSTVTLLEKNYNLTTHFTVKTLKDHGKSKLKFIIDTELNIVKDDNTILQVNKKGNNGRLLLDKSLSNYLDLRATSSNIGALNIFLILWIVLFMFSLGLSFSGNTLKGLYKWKRLKPFICGYVCQLIINPLMAFILTKIFKLSDYISLGVIIVAASPGSFIAPVFTYYLGGDRALAVGLCLVATILGSFTFPLAIWLFCFVLSIKIETYIPFWETFSLTATQIVPLGIGCLILHFKPNWASKLKKGAPIWAFAIILTSLITSLKNYGQIFVNRWEAYSMPIILGIISYTIGFVFPRTLGLNNQEVRAICFNTGLQNSPLAIAVIQVLGTPSCSNLISLVPLHHSLWTVLEGVIVGVTMFFIFPNTVKPIIENSEYPMNAGRSEEENKAILQDDGSDNYSNNTSLLDTVNVLDISDINIRQHYLPKNNINNNNNNNNNNLSSSEMTMISNNHNQNIISPPSPTPTSYSAKIFRGGSVNSRSSHSTITPKYTSLNRINKQRSHSDAPMPKKTNKNTNTDTNTNENTNTNSFSNSNSNSNSFSNSNSNNLTPTLNATSIYQQRKNSSASTIKFNINNPNYLKSHSSLNKNNFDLGIEIIDISDMSDDDDDEDDENTSVNGVVNPTFNHHYQDNNKSPNITNHNNKDSTTTNNNHQQQIPIIYVHNTNNQSSSPIIAYSPQQNSNTHSNNESSRSISVVSNNPNHTPTKSETNSTSSKEGTIKTNKYYNNNTNHTDDLIEFSIDTSTETNSSSNDKSELSNSYHHGKGKEDLEDYHHNHNRSNSQSGGSNSDTNSKNKITDRIRQHNKKKLSHPQINFSQMMKQYLPLVFKKPTNNDVATSNTSSTSTSSNQINSNDNISPKDNNNNINNDNVNNDISNNNINNNDNTNSIVNNSVEKMNDHRNSHSNEGENNNTTSSIHSLNLNQRDNNKNYPNLNNSNNNSSMSMNNSNSNMHRISINNDFINESSTTNSDYKNQETEFHSINSANNSSILNSINKDNKNKDINVNLYPFDNSQIKHLDPMDSIEYITLSNNDLTNYSHYSNSIKSLRRKKHAVQRTDTIQTYETACSSMFKSISSENENFKHVKDGDDDDDDIEEYDEVDEEEEDDDDDEIFKDCTFEFQNTKGKNEFEFF